MTDAVDKELDQLLTTSTEEQMNLLLEAAADIMVEVPADTPASFYARGVRDGLRAADMVRTGLSAATAARVMSTLYSVRDESDEHRD